MPQIQYPFIDIAVHPAVRTRFAAGEAVVIFSRDMDQVLWADGEGAKLFGYANIYDLYDNGPDRTGVAFRQLTATARQLSVVGDRRGLTMRISTGFVSQAVSAEVSLVEIRAGEIVVIFSAPVAANAAAANRIASMLKGFDDPDTHMAIVDDEGAVLAASPGFDGLGIRRETAVALIAALTKNRDGLIKRPIASGAGYLPAAIGRISEQPPLNLLFCVETVLGRMDPPQESTEPQTDSIAESQPPQKQEPAAEEPEFINRDIAPAADEREASADDIVRWGDTEIVSMLPGSDTNIDDGATEEHASPAGFVAYEPPAEGISEQTFGTSEDTSLELVADQAETASQHSGDNEAVSESEYEAAAAVPARLELAADEAEAFEPVEPEDLIRADHAEALLNEGESDGDVEDLAMLDGDKPGEPEAVADNAFDAEQPEIHEAFSVVESEALPADELSASDLPGTVSPDAATDGKDTAPEQAVAPAPDLSRTGPEPLTADAAEPEFEFQRDGRPVRFVWKLDAKGHFSEVSPEFARTVGPRSGNINGMSYRDLNKLFDLDPSNEIGALLERRDTWSGKTIWWPVEGTNLIVPVDLAALPTYSRNREFDGFRGFGIIRVGDAEEDPHAVGMILAKDEDDRPATDAMETADTEFQPGDAPVPSADEVPLTVDPLFSDGGDIEGAHEPDPEFSEPSFSEADFSEPILSEPSTIVTADLPLSGQRDFRGEVPVLRTEPDPIADMSEKVIQLEERRARNREGLTQAEQNALKEIARQLEPFGKRPNDALNENDDQPLSSEAEAEAASEHRAPDIEIEDAAAVQDMAEPVDADDSAAVEPEADREDEVPAEPAPDAPSLTPPPADLMTPEVKDEDGDDEDEEEDEDDAAIGLTASAVDQIPFAILIHAGDRLIFANSEFRRLTGYDSLGALESAGGLDALITRREGQQPGVYTIRADGTEVPVSARLQSVRYEGAKLLMLTLLQAEAPPPFRDEIAEDHEAARKLAALSVEVDELRSILETATDGVIVLDTEGRIRSMNRSASALFNFEDSETRGKPFAMLFAHESQKAVQDYLNGLAGHGVASVLNDGREVIGRESAGGFIPMFMTMGRMPGSNSYCAVIRDITQWKRSEEELKSAKRAAETANQHKSDFLARVSHEIRTPLNAIIGFSDMIASEHFGPAGHPRYVEYANDIGRSGRHVLDIVNDLLDISKIEAGEMELDFAAVGINDCVSEAVSLVQPQANTQRVIIRTSLSQSVPDVVADLRSIKQIAINILANAVRFTPSGGQIVVSTAYETNGSVALRIRDTGVGMSKSELEQAMKPFGQVSPGARKRGDGTGLGLPLTRAMTEANRAMFTIQSSPNEGTLVEIVFPPQRVLAD